MMCRLCRRPADQASEHCEEFNQGVGCQRWSHHPAPWWYRLAMRLFPSRCRAIPEAIDPWRCVLRQVAIIKRYVYLQQFASPEAVGWYHSHQWRRTFAIGLWGAYTEHRLAGPQRTRKAPYLYTMDSHVVHRVGWVSPGHTSLFIGVFRDDDLKVYVAPTVVPWDQHIQAQVKRI